MLLKAALLGIILIIFAVTISTSSTTLTSAGTNTWTSNGPEGGFIRALAIDPITPSTVYAGTTSGGVFKSTDGGGSWNAVNTGLTDTVVYELAIDPQTPNTI